MLFIRYKRYFEDVCSICVRHITLCTITVECHKLSKFEFGIYLDFSANNTYRCYVKDIAKSFYRYMYMGVSSQQKLSKLLNRYLKIL